MNILINAATYSEIAFLFKKRNRPIEYETFRKGKNRIVAAVTGPGMVSTVYHMLQIFEKKRKTDLVINIGLAGTFDKKIKLGQVVQVTVDCFPEVGAQDGKKFISIFDLKLSGKNQFPFKNGKLNPKGLRKVHILSVLKKCKGITVNTVHGNKSDIEKIKRTIKPDVETMEGAAVFYTCMKKNIPCIQLRAISNRVERRNRKAWQIIPALKNLEKITLQLLDEL